MLRRQFVTGLLMTVVLTVLLGFVYPLVVTGISQVTMSKRANGSLVKQNGKVVGSALIGQNFTDKDGNALVQYFQPRPSKAGDGYDAMSSSGSNLGPSNPNLVGNIPGVSISDATNIYATASDPYCVPVQATDKDGNDVTDQAGNAVYEKNKDGTYVCDSGTVPERVLAYRTLNGLAADVKVPADAVTASGSGLDPQISVANARLQAARVAKARNLTAAQVTDLIAAHTQSRQLGVLGEQTVNVLELNLSLDRLR
ncbi:MAG TPA: potassium-transporting ATPase subunit C [Acidimicrobiia bacterium]